MQNAWVLNQEILINPELYHLWWPQATILKENNWILRIYKKWNIGTDSD